ncbi:MAG: hypothetical protein WHV67_08620 [Thermoanaerobaculia bacterium]
MEKILKSHLLGKLAICIFFFSLHISFIISLLNPQMPVTTGSALILLTLIFIFSSLTFGIFLFFVFFKFHKYSNLIFIFFCFSVVMIYIVEKNLHPLFFHPSLYKLLNKGIWTSSITFLGILFLKDHKRVLAILLIASSIFLYQRRDAIKFKKTATYSMELELEDKPKFHFYVFETSKSENFIQELKEKEEYKGIYKILEEGSRGVFQLPSYFDGEVLRCTIFTGTYPYVHRNFGDRTNVFLPLYNFDIFPFLFPGIFKREISSQVPYLWEILENFKMPVRVEGFGAGYGYKKEEAVFHIYYRSFMEKDLTLGKDLEKIKDNLKEKDYICFLLPQKGFFYIKGKDIKEDFIITSMKLVDPVPTILYLYDLPLGNYLSGRILSECIKEDYLKENPIGVIGKY